MSKQIESTEPRLTPEQQARRRLLKLGAYVPPAILGMAIMAQTGRALAEGNKNRNGNGNENEPSCCPRGCAPCGNANNRNRNRNENKNHS